MPGNPLSLSALSYRTLSHCESTGVYSPIPAQELARLALQGAVGHLCGHFLRADGSLVEADDAPFVLGIGADGLQHIAKRIAVAKGRQKVVPIAAAISGGVIPDLVTDHTTAADLVQLFQA
ncbi:DNA-binding transcriptional regulator LsrR (DeoR family) [Arthrobacter pascens]|uniref:sugar-binding domain-containing protein n=1 Tax=Arthrobacter pascens TaxID=1677 RepID=UPI00278E19D9|nr:sugar-binding domain-containing protein [Arthrobacter pascens]MDQ0677009.1 DNA-binding transcriptional regulator LsrR (DeoR family) [Arthrobacter pascens]